MNDATKRCHTNLVKFISHSHENVLHGINFLLNVTFLDSITVDDIQTQYLSYPNPSY